MHKLALVIVASAFAFSATGFAQDTAKKKEELTKEERAEMRNRAEKLKAERTTHPAPRAERSTQPAAQGKTAAMQTAASKPTELTPEERAEMRNRAEKLKAERARTVTR
jgi:hypothetical protein